MPPPNVSAPPATQGDEDPQSPTVMLQAYLRSKGMPLTADNMRRVLTENARGSVDIPSLTNQAPPSTDPSVGQRGNVAAQVERGNLPVPPVPPRGGDYGDAENPPVATGGGTNTPATSSNMPLGALIAAGAGPALGMWAANRFGSPSASAPPTPGGSVPPPPELSLNPANAGIPGRNPGAGPPGPQDVVDYTQLDPAQMGNRFQMQPTDMEVAMQRAIAPAAGMPPAAVGPGTAIGPMSPTNVVANPPPAPGTTVQEAGQRIMPRPPMADRSLEIPRPPVPHGVVPRVKIQGLHIF